MYLKFNNKSKLRRRQAGALLGTGVLLALAGCSGGSSNGSGNNANAGLPSASLVALTSNNRLLAFNSRTPNSATTINVTGLTAGDLLKGIDFRFTPPSTVVDSDGNTGLLYALGQNGTSAQVYRITSAGAATAVGARFDISPAPSAFGFDFNPTVDRIRLIESGQNRNYRLNPNTGAVAATDTSLAYASTDSNSGQEPDAVGAAYTNVDSDTSTGTLLYVIDAARNTLVTQGNVDGSVSPNTGQLFTVANLTVDPDQNTGFDIAGNTTGFLSINKRIYGIDLATGATSGGASVGFGGNVIDIAVVSSAQNN